MNLESDRVDNEGNKGIKEKWNICSDKINVPSKFLFFHKAMVMRSEGTLGRFLLRKRLV